MAKASPLKYAFNAGELTGLMDGRLDQAKVNNGCSILRNLLTTVQGPLIRRGGTYYVGETKNSANRSWLWRFQFNVFQSYILEFGNLYIRFYTSRSQVLSGMAAYEIPAPWASADLVDADGCFALDFEQSNDVIYITSTKNTFTPYKLQRLGNTNWTITEYVPDGGPFKKQNIDATSNVYASGETGTVTLNSSQAIFQAGHVGSLFYLEQKVADIVPQWESGKVITAGLRRRSDGKNYEALNGATTGGVKPTHSVGSAYDGDAGVQWDFRDPGYGWARITAVSNANTATAEVLSRIPAGAVGSGNATTRWAHGAWSTVEGFPDHVCFFRERLSFMKRTTVYASCAADYENFQTKQFGQVVADRAFTVELPTGNPGRWMSAAGELVVGTAGEEFSIGEITTNDPLGPANVRVKPQTNYSGRNVKPVKIGDTTIFADSAGRKLRDIAYTFDTNGYKGRDLNVLAEHLTRGGIVDMDYAKGPYSILWACTARGKLIGLTYNQEQDVYSWHPHNIGGNGFVESVRVIPSPDNTRDELWLIVRRTINGVTKRYVEYMVPEYDASYMRQQDSFYVDCGLSLYNTISTTLLPGVGANVKGTENVTFMAGSPVFSLADIGKFIHYDYIYQMDKDGETIDTPQKGVALITGFVSDTTVSAKITKAFPSSAVIPSNGWRRTVTSVGGLGHLEGQTVDVLIDGASHPRRVVTGGIITLQNPASVVHVGLPAPCKMRTMRVEGGSAQGTAQGKMKRSNLVTVRMKDSLGGTYGARDEQPELFNEIIYRTGDDEVDAAPELFTGDKNLTMPEGYDTDGYVIIKNDQPFPMTLICLVPNMEVMDR